MIFDYKSNTFKCQDNTLRNSAREHKTSSVFIADNRKQLLFVQAEKLARVATQSKDGCHHVLIPSIPGLFKARKQSPKVCHLSFAAGFQLLDSHSLVLSILNVHVKLPACSRPWWL